MCLLCGNGAFMAITAAQQLFLFDTIPLSKWAQLVQSVEQNPVHLAGYGEQLKQDMREFRETFVFPHDISL